MPRGGAKETDMCRLHVYFVAVADASRTPSDEEAIAYQCTLHAHFARRLLAKGSLGHAGPVDADERRTAFA